MSKTTVEITPTGGKHANGAAPYDFTGHHFLNTADLPQDAFLELVERALALKKAGYESQLLKGTVLGMIFFNPSLRTKMSLASGVARLGGTAIDLTVGQSAYTFEFEEGVV